MKEKAPVDLTGGLGFNFEDRVAARLLLDLLLGRAPLGTPRGVPLRVHWQARDLRWLADDLVCELSAGANATQVGLSIKLDRQVTEGGFDAAFVEAAWRHALVVGGRPAIGDDAGALVLVVGKLANSVSDAWGKLQRQAIETPPDRLAARLAVDTDSGRQSSEVERALFASLRCPESLQSHGESGDHATARLIRAVYLLHFDFTLPTSQDESRAVLDAQTVVRSGDRAGALALWQRLVSLAASKRGSGGALDMPGLVAELRGSFALVDNPDYRADWRTLHELTKEALEDVRTTIAGLPAIDRDEVRARVAGELEEKGFCVLAGESGVGKSALAKEVAARAYGRALWLAAEQLDGDHAVTVRDRLGLEHPLADVLASARERTLLVVDSTERLTGASLSRLARLAHDVRGRGAEVHLLATTVSESADRLVTALAQNGCGRMEPVELERPTEEAIGKVVRNLEGLRWTVLRPEVRPALRNLKVLEWVVQAIAEGEVFDSTSILNVSGLIERLWTRWAEGDQRDLRRSYILMELGAMEAESLSRGIPRTALGLDAAAVLPDLARSDLVRVRDERVSFTHDLLGDWARLRVLIGEAPGDGAAITRRCVKPRWHRAIRLYGQWLLDRGSEGIAQWRALVRQDADNSEARVIARDLLLESAFLASDADTLLEQVWPQLASDDGRPLEILLERFLYVATVTDPTIEARLGPDMDIAEVEHLFRVPVPGYWGEMLTVLHRHREEVKVLVPEVAARIAKTWLTWTPTTAAPGKRIAWRLEAADLAITIAREVQARGEEGDHLGKDTKVIFEALLQGAPDRPEEVAALCLELCHRRPLSGEASARRDAAISAREEKRREWARNDPDRAEMARYLSTPLVSRGEMREQAPDGPVRRVSEGFAEACRTPDAFSALCQTDPAVACEVLLAVTIEEPRHQDPYGAGTRHDDLGLTYWQGGYPAMYWRGPFLRFLREAPQYGLTFVIRLVNYATDRWAQAGELYGRMHGRAEGRPSVLIARADAPRDFVGDGQVLQWHYDSPLGPGAVACALMALEKWLYDAIDAGQDVTLSLERLLDEGSSLALIGVLIDVGKRQPALFEGPLRPLLAAWELHYADSNSVLSHSVGIAPELIPWNGGSARLRVLAVDWFGMPHRKLHLWDVATRLLLTRPEMHPFFEETRAHWRDLLKDGEPHQLRLLIERLTLENYVRCTLPDGSDGVVLQWPEEIQREHAKDAPSTQAGFELMALPMRARKWLNGEETFPDSELPHLWEVAQTLASQAPDVDQQERPTDPRDALFGLIATFVTLGGVWLREDPARLKWCRTELEHLLAVAPVRRAFSDTPSRFESGFDAFAAEAGVALMVLDQQDALGRELVAGGVTSWRAPVVAVTMASAFRNREALGADDFERLQSVAVQWSAIRGPARLAEHLHLDVDTYFERQRSLIEGFVSRVAITRPQLADVDDAAREGFSAIDENLSSRDEDEGIDRAGRWKRAPFQLALDDAILSAAFDSMDFRQARTDSERGSWMQFLREAFDLVLEHRKGRRSARPKKRGNHDEPKPLDDFERWVLARVACALPLLDEAPSESLWKPVLALGPDEHYVVEAFLGSWFTGGASVTPSMETFTSRWQAMLRFALDDRNWASRGRHDYDFAGIVNALLGIGSAWPFAGYGPINAFPAGMLLLFSEAASRWLTIPTVFERWARLACATEGRVLLLPSLTWLADAVSRFDQSAWRSPSISQLLVRYLRAVWRAERNAIRGDEARHKAFELLLNAATVHGGHDAQCLRDQVLESVREG
jgi:hypothetical protein